MDLHGYYERSASHYCPQCGRPFSRPEKHGIVFEGNDVLIDGRRIHLGMTATAVLRALAERFGSIVHHDRLFTKIWGGLDVGETNVKVQISKLRAKLAQTRLEIRNSFGEGYGLYDRPTPKE